MPMPRRPEILPDRVPATPEQIPDNIIPDANWQMAKGWDQPPPNRTADEIIALENARRVLGLRDETLSFSAMDAYKYMAKFLEYPLTVSMLSVKGWRSIEQIDKAEQVCVKIAENQEVGRQYTPEERLGACRILAMCAEARKSLGAHLVDLSEKLNKNHRKERRLNAPPVAFQVNVNSGPNQPNSVSIAQVKNGNGEPKQSDEPAQE